MNLMTDKHHIAVITGDVISSRQSGPEVWMPALKSILARFGEQPSDWEIHRGDAFQLMIICTPRWPSRRLGLILMTM